MSAHERTAWRDAGLSEFHWLLGFHVPMTDIDFLAIEYDSRLPIALIEHKHIRGMSAAQFAREASCTAARWLADNSLIPFLLVRYTSDFQRFEVTPFNDIASRSVRSGCYTQREYVELLYSLRRRTMPENLPWNVINTIRSTPL